MSYTLTSEVKETAMRVVSIEAAFNLAILDEILLIDCRPVSDFDSRHIESAICVDPAWFQRPSASVLRGSDFVDFVCSKLPRDVARLWLCRRRRVVLYDESSSSPDSIVSQSQSARALAGFLSTDDQNKEFGVLNGGISAISREIPAFVVDSKRPFDGEPATPVRPARPSPFPCAGRPVVEARNRLFPSVVVPGFLYLGGCTSRLLTKSLGITHVLCIGADASWPPLPLGVTEMVIDVGDSQEETTPLFPRAVDFIQKASAQGGRVLVHCSAGVSRSPTFVTAFLMTSRRLSFSEAISRVHRCRPIIRPNPEFIASLICLEKSLNLPDQLASH